MSHVPEFMHPILLKLGPVTLYSYGLMFAAAFLVVVWQVTRATRRGPPELAAIPADHLLDFACLLLLGGIVGGRLFYVALDWESYLRNPLEIFALWHGGLIWYGGFLGSLAAGWCYTRAKRIQFFRMTDQFIPFLALGHAIGRIGCFLNGCCYGRPTTSWCGVTFPGHAEAVLPTQLVEAAGLFLLFIILRRCQRPEVLRHPGRLFGGYLVLYGILRFAIEFLRGDQPVWWAGLTLQQLVSLGAILVGFILVISVRRGQT